jgi:hypothetical protein
MGSSGPGVNPAQELLVGLPPTERPHDPRQGHLGLFTLSASARLTGPYFRALLRVHFPRRRSICVPLALVLPGG